MSYFDRGRWRFSGSVKTVALLVNFFFITNTLTYAQGPLAAMQGSGFLDVRAAQFIQDLKIPSAFGKIQERYAAGSARVILIQDAHSQTGAQRNIQKMLEYLKAQYDVKAIFLEGAFQGKVPKDLLRIEKDPQIDQELAERFFKKGLVSGAGLYLFHHPDGMDGYGMEAPELYVRNVQQFRGVYQKKAEADKFLNAFREKILTAGSRIFNPSLREFHREWAAYLDSRRDTLNYFNLLAKYTKRCLGFDLRDPWNQFDYPQLVRLFALRHLEKTASGDDKEKLEDEKKAVFAWLRSVSVHAVTPYPNGRFSNMDQALLDVIFSSDDDSLSIDLRSYFEDFYTKYRSRGFSFEKYPALRRRIGRLILSQELDTEKLSQEADQLTQKILEKLAVNRQEKKLVGFFDDYRLLRKLFALELNKKEYLELKKDPAHFFPSAIVKHLNLPATERVVALDALFSQALDFYQTATRREQILFANMCKALKKNRLQKSVLIVGGFHSEGLEVMLKEQGISYVSVVPKISKVENNQNYLDHITLKNVSGSKGSTVPAYGLDRVSLKTLERFDPLGARYLAGMVQDELLNLRLGLSRTPSTTRSEKYAAAPKATAPLIRQPSIVFLPRFVEGAFREPQSTAFLGIMPWVSSKWAVKLNRAEVRIAEKFSAHADSDMTPLPEQTGYAQTFMFNRTVQVDRYEELMLSFSDSTAQARFGRNLKRWEVYVYPIAPAGVESRGKSTAEKIKGSGPLYLKRKGHWIAYPENWPKALAGLRLEFKHVADADYHPPVMPEQIDLSAADPTPGEVSAPRLVKEEPAPKPVREVVKEDFSFLKGMSTAEQKKVKRILGYAQRSLAISVRIPLEGLQELRKKIETVQGSAELDLQGLTPGVSLKKWLGAESQLEFSIMQVRKALKETAAMFRKLAQAVNAISEYAPGVLGVQPLQDTEPSEVPYETSPLRREAAVVQEPWMLADEMVNAAIQGHFSKIHAELPVRPMTYQGQTAAVERLAELKLAGHILTPQMVKIESDPKSNGTMHFKVSVDESMVGRVTTVLPLISEEQKQQEAYRRIIARWNYISMAAREPWLALQDQLRELLTAEANLRQASRDHDHKKFSDYEELNSIQLYQQ